jgi:hypothetical protein
MKKIENRPLPTHSSLQLIVDIVALCSLSSLRLLALLRLCSRVRLLRRSWGSLARCLSRLRSFLLRRHVRINAVLALLLDELREILNGAGARVVDGFVLGTGRVELDGWEALDLVRYVVSGGVDLRDDYFAGIVWVVEVKSCEFLVFRSKTAVYS